MVFFAPESFNIYRVSGHSANQQIAHSRSHSSGSRRWPSSPNPSIPVGVDLPGHIRQSGPEQHQYRTMFNSCSSQYDEPTDLVTYLHRRHSTLRGTHSTDERALSRTELFQLYFRKMRRLSNQALSVLANPFARSTVASEFIMALSK